MAVPGRAARGRRSDRSRGARRSVSPDGVGHLTSDVDRDEVVVAVDEEGRDAESTEPSDQVVVLGVPGLRVEAVLDRPRRDDALAGERRPQSSRSRGRAGRAAGRPSRSGSGSTRGRSRRRRPGSAGPERRADIRSDCSGDRRRCRSSRKATTPACDAGAVFIRMRCDTRCGPADRVLHREQRAPGVAEDGDRLEPEGLADRVEIVDLTREVDLVRRSAGERSTAAALVVVHEAERVGQAIHVGEQVLVVEVRSSVQDDDGRAVADLADVQPRRRLGEVALACAAGSAAAIEDHSSRPARWPSTPSAPLEAGRHVALRWTQCPGRRRRRRRSSRPRTAGRPTIACRGGRR